MKPSDTLLAASLDLPDATSDQAGVPLLDEDYLMLSTIHSAKGQEWKSVYVRRLLNVAMTRAKDDLHRTVSVRRATGTSTHRGPGSSPKSSWCCSGSRDSQWEEGPCRPAHTRARFEIVRRDPPRGVSPEARPVAIAKVLERASATAVRRAPRIYDIGGETARGAHPLRRTFSPAAATKLG